MSVVGAPPVSPFRGLAAFGDSELDALFFFGRERERDVIVANLLASRLTVLYGESGVGKSSLLAAGVVPELRRAAPDARVALHDTWSGELADLAAEFGPGEEGYLILDQFEEYFLYHGDELPHALPELLETTRVSVLISLREDSLARLDAFKAAIPGVFSNRLRLEHLDVEQARRAILGPLARWEELTGEHVDAEPALVEAVVDDVAVAGGRVEAPYLQLVLERVWQEEREAGSWLLRRATLDRLGGAAAIVRDQFRGALDSLAPADQDVAAAMFEHLVTPTGGKIALHAADLAEYAHVPEDALRRVLDRLTRERVVHGVEGSERYEIFHDVLAEPIGAWRVQRQVEHERAAARRRQRRLYAVVVVVLVALAVVAALAAWALSERGAAQRQAHHAHARELEATALRFLPIDPSRSLRLALAAAKLEPSTAAEDVLRQALVVDRLRLVRREAAPVTAVAVSPSGRLVAVALTGVGVQLRAAMDGRVVRLLPAPSVHDVAFSPDGRELVGAAIDGVATRWSIRTGAPLPTEPPTVAARLPSGTFALVRARGDLRRALRNAEHVVAAPGGAPVAASVRSPNGRRRPWIFDRSGRRVRVLPEIGTHALAFSPDGRLLAASSATGVVVLWDARTWKRLRSLPDAKQGANAIAFSPDGKLLATAGDDGGVRVWTVATGERTYFLFGHTTAVESLAWSPDGRVLASGSQDRTIRLWRIQGLIGSGSLAATLPGDTAAVTALAFTPDGARLVSGSADRTVRWWAAAPDEQLRVLGRAPGAAVAAAWAGRTIAAAWSSGVVETWAAGGSKPSHVLTSGGVGATSLALSEDGSAILAGRADGGADAWQADGRRLSPGRLHAPVVAVALSTRGGAAEAAEARGRVEVWETSSGRVLWRGAPGAAVAALAFSPDGDVLAVSGGGGAVLHAAKDGRVLHRLTSPGGDARASFSPGGRYVATAGGDGDARLWFAATGRLYRVLRGHAHAVNDVAFSRDGSLLATAGADADVRVWNVATGRGQALARAASGTIPDVGFDPTGRWVVAAAPISAVIWDARTGQQLFYLRGHGPLLTSASFAPDGSTVLTSSRDGTVRTYDCTVCVGRDALVASAERRLAAGG